MAMELEIQRYQDHLNRVSRSFAFCIARLEGDLRPWVSLAYLLCRILDTIEDALWDSQAKQDNSFSRFDSFLHVMPARDLVNAWSLDFPQEIPEGEKILIKDAYFIFERFHAQPQPVKTVLLRAIKNMRRGMQRFSTANGKKVELKNIAEVNQYCFFVAGLVGELLTELLHIHRKLPGAVAESLLLSSHHFGLFLQKVNLLKDQAADEKEGRFLVPSRTELLASLRKNADGALAYILRIPAQEKGFRLFCAWSLFLGLSALPWAQKGFRLGLVNKIPRIFTERLLHLVESIIDDNQALQRLFLETLPNFPLASPSNEAVLSLDWFQKIYEGNLSSAHLADLGMLPSR